MTKLIAAALCGIPTYFMLGALDVSMTDAKHRAESHVFAVARVPAAAPAAPQEVTLQRVVVVGKRLPAGGEVMAQR